MMSSVFIILYIILGTSNADRYLLVEVGDELEEAVPNENTNYGKQSGFRRSSGYRSFTWAPPPMKIPTTTPAPPPGIYVYQEQKNMT